MAIEPMIGGEASSQDGGFRLCTGIREAENDEAPVVASKSESYTKTKHCVASGVGPLVDQAKDSVRLRNTGLCRS